MSIKQRFADNLHAIRALYSFESNEIGISDAQEAIKSFTGWGGFNSILSEGSDELVDELKGLVGEACFLELLTSVLDAYYTPQPVAEFICDYIASQGLSNKHTVLDPAFGLGAMTMPLQRVTRIEGVEIDNLTARLSAVLNPSVNISNKGFEATACHPNTYAAVIANPPWGAHRVYDSLNPNWSKLSIHNYFLLKMMHLTAQGGVFAAVVTASFLDQRMPNSLDEEAFDARRVIAHECDLVAAFRLPSNVFSQSNTQTVSDIVIFRKRTKEEQISHEAEELPSWTRTSLHKGTYVSINEYFVEKPHHILGKAVRTQGKWHAFMDVVAGDFERDLAIAKDALPNILFAPQVEKVEDGLQDVKELGLDDDALEEPIFEFFLNANTQTYVQRIEEARFLNFPNITVGSTKEKRLLKAFELSETLMALLSSDQSGDLSIESSELRALLNSKYDDFVKKFGAINSQANRFMLDDNRLQHLFGLELNYAPAVTKRISEKTGEAERPSVWDKNDIFMKPVTGHHEEITWVETIEEALTSSLLKHGRVDFEYMAGITRFSVTEIKTGLNGDYIFYDPELRAWVTRDQYLSGNLKTKLKAALANKEYLDLDANIAALKEACPEDVPTHAIKIPFMAAWLPLRIIKEFVTHITGDVAPEIEKLSGSFICDELNARAEYNATFGTRTTSAGELLGKMINAQPIIVYTKVGNDRVIDHKATLAAKNQVEKIAQEWSKWLFADESRANELTEMYNDTLNCFALPQFDGSHLTVETGMFEDQSNSFKYRAHQVNAVWQNLSNRGGLVAHEVGSGKSATAIAAAYLGEKMGIYKNPIIVVPKNTLIHWHTEFLRIFPNANVLLVDDSNKSSKSSVRRRLLARIGLGKWSGVIMSHEVFKSIDAPLDGLQIAADEMSDAAAQLPSTDNAKLSKMAARRIKSARNLSQRQTSKSTLKRGYTFDMLATNKIFVDESQQFKSLAFGSQHSDIKGLGDMGGSARSFDLLTKIRHVNARHSIGSRGITFLTGTALSNSIGEVFTLGRYLYNDKMKELGFRSFDGFISTYSVPQSQYELTITGDFKPSTRFRSFSNLTELSALFSNFSDCVDKEYLQNFYEDAWPEPKMKNGKPNDIIVEPDSNFSRYNSYLVYRAENMGQLDAYPNDNMLSIASANRSASMDLRLAKDLDEADIELVNYNSPKTLAVAREVGRIYKEVKADEKGTQLIFISEGTPKANSNVSSDVLSKFTFSTYHDLRQKLINEHDVKPNDIAFVHDAKSDADKERLFAKVRAGTIRILIGSARIMGAGTNVQTRIVALHCVSHSWTASEFKQCLGRGLRQQNKFFDETFMQYKAGLIEKKDLFEVEVHRYGMRLSLDAFIIQAAETKARLFDAFLSTKGMTTRNVVLADEGNVDFREFKARVSGRPELLMKVQNDETLRKLYAIKEDGIYKNRTLEYMVKQRLPEEIDQLTKVIEDMEKEAVKYAPAGSFHSEGVKGLELVVKSRKKKQPTYKTLYGALSASAKVLASTREYTAYLPVLVARQSGFDFFLILDEQARPTVLQISYEGNTVYMPLSSGLSVGHTIKTQLRTYANFANDLEHKKSELSRLKDNLNAKSKIAKSVFDYERELTESQRLDQLLTLAIESGESTIDGVYVPDLPLVDLNCEEAIAEDEIYEVKRREPTKYASLHGHTNTVKPAKSEGVVVSILDGEPPAALINGLSQVLDGDQYAFNF